MAELVETDVEKCGAEPLGGQETGDFEEEASFALALMGWGEVSRPPPPSLFGLGLFPERSLYSVYRL